MGITYNFFKLNLANINSASRHSCINLFRKCSSKPLSNNDIQPFLYNRNPRNLERMRLQRKPLGYGIDLKENHFFHRLVYGQSKYSIFAKLIHNTNVVVVEASTNEWAIRKFLYSAKDMQANIILAKVFAYRCIESGMTTFHCAKPIGQSEKYDAFYKILEDIGLILEEPDFFDIHDIWRKKREKRPWTVLED